jgi:transposase
MTTDHEFAVVASTTDVQKVFVAIELSKSTWVVAIQPPAVDKVSLFRIAGGEIERLFELFEQARRRAGQPIEICACYEAGYDGFWIYRALTARGVACTVLDSASIQVSRRARRVKTDRTDAESLVRVLMAIYRGEHQVAKIVQVPSPEEEDDKRLLRCRGNLLRDRIQHMNRIRGLAHGVSFVSVTQSFNTTTSMGRLTLNVLLSFAQFEREVTGERIRDKIAASKKKGMWMGGVVPLGYRVEDRGLHLVEDHAAIVRSLFRRYLEAGTVVRLKQQLDAESFRVPIRIRRRGPLDRRRTVQSGACL